MLTQFGMLILVILGWLATGGVVAGAVYQGLKIATN